MAHASPEGTYVLYSIRIICMYTSGEMLFLALVCPFSVLVQAFWCVCCLFQYCIVCTVQTYASVREL